jgi:hypothetical protein
MWRVPAPGAKSAAVTAAAPAALATSAACESTAPLGAPVVPDV